MRTLILSSVALLVSLIAACSGGGSDSSSSSSRGAAADGGTSASSGGSSSGTSGASSSGGSLTEDTSVNARCLEGGAGDVKDGWTRTIGADGVTMLNGNVGVAVGWSLQIDDQLRAAPHFAEGVWDRLLGDEYEVQGTRTSGGDDFGQIAFSSGFAKEKASGSVIYITLTASRDNGVAFPVAALAADDLVLKQKFANPADIDAMRAYNAFPLSCSSIVGKWTTNNSNAVALYDKYGSFTGIKVSSLQIDASFDTAKHYEWNVTVTDNTGVQAEDESGQYASGDLNIDLSSIAGKATNYDAAFVAVKGGLALSVVNKQFSGNRWVFYRAN